MYLAIGGVMYVTNESGSELIGLNGRIDDVVGFIKI